jgi:RecA-family ATPase
MRPKWDKRRGATQTYGDRTIAKANQECGEVYSGADAMAPDGHVVGAAVSLPSYLEPIAAFLAEEDPPTRWIFPDLLHTEVLMLIHGEPRARKSLVGFELALSAATGTAPFGLPRFQPEAAVVVWYIQEEDARSLTRQRLRHLVQERCGISIPDTLHVSVRRGIDLDDPVWVTRIIADAKRLGVRFLVLDAARRLSIKTDEGPAKVRELIAALRSIVTEAGVTIAIVHHDVKPSANGQDVRRRSQRASGGDWFAACECPVHVERVNETRASSSPKTTSSLPTLTRSRSSVWWTAG